MKFTKILGLVAMAAVALMAFASTASATTLEVKGVTQTGAVSIESTLKGSSALLTDTFNAFANTCTASTVAGTTSTKTGTAVEGSVSTLSFGTETTKCSEGNPTVDAAGSLSIERIGTTTNGTVKSKNAKVTVPSAFGPLTCTTPSTGTDLGTLTGGSSGFSTITINAVLSCGFDAKWTGTYTVTTPEGLGVVG